VEHHSPEEDSISERELLSFDVVREVEHELFICYDELSQVSWSELIILGNCTLRTLCLFNLEMLLLVTDDVLEEAQRRVLGSWEEYRHFKRE
jgi:hypothetical protein